MAYGVDIVLCIDSTGSMTPVIEQAKSGALRFQEDLKARMAEKAKEIGLLRIRVISFRDYYHDGAPAMEASDFFRLPDQKKEYEAFVRSIQAKEGGDEPENGLEALAIAMNSDWTTEGEKQRQVICLWTDASAHALDGHAEGKPRVWDYPNGMPANFNELTHMWDDKMNGDAKRLLLYAPDASPWTDIFSLWNNVLHYPSKAGEGLADKDYKIIIEQIAASLKLQ